MEDVNDLDPTPLPSTEMLRRLAVSESGFVFDPASGHNFTLNDTGLRLLRLLQQGRRLDEVLAELGAEFSGDPREMERDILEFVSTLREYVGA